MVPHSIESIDATVHAWDSNTNLVSNGIDGFDQRMHMHHTIHFDLCVVHGGFCLFEPILLSLTLATLFKSSFCSGVFSGVVSGVIISGVVYGVVSGVMSPIGHSYLPWRITYFDVQPFCAWGSEGTLCRYGIAAPASAFWGHAFCLYKENENRYNFRMNQKMEKELWKFRER
jgi:hypothetical protein